MLIVRRLDPQLCTVVIAQVLCLVYKAVCGVQTACTAMASGG